MYIGSRITALFICLSVLFLALTGCSEDGQSTGGQTTIPSVTTTTAASKSTSASTSTSGTSVPTTRNNDKMVFIKSLSNGNGFTMKVGDTKQMTVVIKPDNATNKAVEWVSTNGAVASVNKYTGFLTAVSAGTARIYVKALDGSRVVDSCTVTVVSGNRKWELNEKHKAVNSSLPYYLYFEKDAYTISVYARGGDGYYSKLVKKISSSRGRTLNMTPTGVFKLTKQKRWYQFQVGKYWTQYCIRYTGDIYLHGPLYKKASGDTMYINEYNQIGTANTSGCLAMVTADIKWIWDNCPDGTSLEIVSGAPIGTMAKTPDRIPENGDEIDPTDPEFI